MQSQFAQKLERNCSGHVISVTCLLFINYLPHLVTSLCQCGVQLAQMGRAGIPSVPGFAQVLRRALRLLQAPVEDWLHCYILYKPQTVSFGNSLGPRIDLDGSLVLLTMA